MADNKKSPFDILNAVNVNEHTETKDTGKVKLTYLSWAWAWAEVKKIYPNATYHIYERETPDGLIINYFTDGKTCWVKTGVTINEIEHIEDLPVMDFKNQSITLDKITSSDVNKAIQRSLTKACARHGFALYIYEGEDIPETVKKEKKEQDEERSRPRWVHNQEGFREHLDLDHHQFVASLFGMHLMNRYPNATINIVESEKTALIMATAYGNIEKNLWLACGGLEFLKVEALRPLIDSGRRVWVWPDKDGVDKWKAKVGHLISDRFGIYTRFFDKYWIEEDGKKADMADINLRLLTRPETINDVKPKEVSDDEKILLDCQEWTVEHDNDPFIDPLVAIDPRVAEWREILRRRYNFINKKQ